MFQSINTHQSRFLSVFEKGKKNSAQQKEKIFLEKNFNFFLILAEFLVHFIFLYIAIYMKKKKTCCSREEREA